jgi:hypothetical protein
LKYELNFYVLVRINPAFKSRVEVGLNTSIVALRVVGGDENGSRYLRIQAGHLVLWKHKYVDPALQIGGVWNLRE